MSQRFLQLVGITERTILENDIFFHIRVFFWRLEGCGTVTGRIGTFSGQNVGHLRFVNYVSVDQLVFPFLVILVFVEGSLVADELNQVWLEHLVAPDHFEVVLDSV
jgi:hypothetical protein